MIPRSESIPVHSLMLMAACSRSMPRPSTVVAPACRARRRNDVSGGLGMTSHTSRSVELASKSSRTSPEPGNPNEVALTTRVADSGTARSSRHSMAEQADDVAVFTRSAMSAALVTLRFATQISDAPASASSTAIARAAPPAPRMRARCPAGSATVGFPAAGVEMSQSRPEAGTCGQRNGGSQLAHRATKLSGAS